MSSAQEQLCPPTFVVKMRNSRVLEGDAVRLECKVAASPTPQLYWKKDKEMLRIDPMRMRSDIIVIIHLWMWVWMQNVFYIDYIFSSLSKASVTLHETLMGRLLFTLNNKTWFVNVCVAVRKNGISARQRAEQSAYVSWCQIPFYQNFLLQCNLLAGLWRRRMEKSV